METIQRAAMLQKANHLFKTHQDQITITKKNGKEVRVDNRYKALIEALQLYQYLAEYLSVEQRISVYRNIGTASLKAAELDPQKASHHLTTSLEHLCKSHQLGIAAKRPEEWQEVLSEKIEDLVPRVVDQDALLSHQEKIFKVKRLLSPYPDLLATMQVMVAKMIFKQTVRTQEEGEWVKSKSALVPLLRTIEESLALLVQDEHHCVSQRMHETWNELSCCVNTHICIADSMVACQNADKMVTLHLNQKVHNMDMMWNILDDYFQAMLLTRGNDVEREAIAASRIGRMYNQVFLIPKKAHFFHRKALELGISLQPRNVTLHKWYLESQRYLQEHQAKWYTEEDAKNNAWKQPFITELEGEIKEINKKFPTDALLKYLWDNYPPSGDPTPSCPLATLPDVKRLQLAIRCYHPDKQIPNETEKRMYVLSEEITKILNDRHDTAKSDSQKK